jgi:hypothetical protein
VPADTATRLLENDGNVVPFMPFGRPKMKEWIQINMSDAEDYRSYLPVFEESIRYINELQEKTRKTER